MRQVYSKEMDLELLREGIKLSVLAERWGISADALSRHRKNLRRKYHSDGSPYNQYTKPTADVEQQPPNPRFARPSFFEEDVNSLARGRR